MLWNRYPYFEYQSYGVCESDNVMFTNFIHNNDPSIRVIFIPDSMIHEFRIIENTYYTESRRGMDPLDRLNGIVHFVE